MVLIHEIFSTLTRLIGRMACKTKWELTNPSLPGIEMAIKIQVIVVSIFDYYFVLMSNIAVLAIICMSTYPEVTTQLTENYF